MDALPARDLVDEVAADFTRRYTERPEAVGRAPGRVNLIGEHTDYNGGLCLPIALPHAAYAAVCARPDDRVRVGSGQTGTWEGTLQGLRPGADGDAAYVAGTLWALREAGALDTGVDVALDSQVPMGSGLSSSAAVICAVAVAVGGDRLSAEELVEVSIRAETEGVGAPTGGLDQTVSVLARPDEALLLDFGRGAQRVADRVEWRPERAGVGLLVVDTRVQHSHSGGGYGNRRAESEAAAAALGVSLLGEAGGATSSPDTLDDPVLASRARHVLSEIERVRQVVAAVRAGDWSAVGSLFTASHVSLRDDYEVSCPELDGVVDSALDGGALGARMTGGGFGGSAVVLAPLDRLEEVAAAVRGGAERMGAPAPRFLQAAASAGARRVKLAG